MASSTHPKSRKKKILIALTITALLIVTATAGAYWWHNRPITPTVLTTSEQSVLDQKVATLQHQATPTYQPGEKTITLSEREVNALFHKHTGLGDQLKFEFADNAIHARIRTKLDPEIPIVGGHTLVAKARFLLKNDNNHPSITLDDLTVWGISLPNAWLGDMKGKNLISDIGLNTPDTPENQFSKGIQHIRIKNGQLSIELAE